MSQTLLPVSSHQPGLSPRIHAGSCPFASNCSCVFNRPAQAAAERHEEDAPGAPSISAQVAEWTSWGWSVVSTSDREIVIERMKKISFCVNAALCIVTAFVWTIFWVARTRHPKVERRVLSISADGQVTPAPSASGR
jgi:hypothetical protein